LALLVVLVQYIHSKNEEVQELKANKAINVILIDSLRDKLFETEMIVGRYEVALSIFKEEDSTAAVKFENIISTKTE